MKEQKRYTQAMMEIMETLLSEGDLSDAIAGGFSVCARTLGAEAGAVWMLHEEDGRLYPVFQVGPADLEGLSIENGSGVEGSVLRSGKSVNIADASEDSRFEGSVFDDQGLNTRTMLCVPMNDLSRIVGCVQIINKRGKDPFDDEDRLLLERFASLAAITIAERGLEVAKPETREVIVTLENVIKEFKNPSGVSRVLKGIDLQIYKGEFLVVLGESGCGKSTMMNIIGGMDYLTSGRLVVEGRDLSHPTDEELTNYRRNYIGFIFQSYNLMPNLNAVDNVRFIAEISPDPMAPEEALGLVGLANKGGSFPSHLSGGQQQRVAIARALVKQPKLILADEPTAALDYETSIEVLSAIEDAVRKQNTTVVMITHNPEIGKMADRVVKLRSGRVFSIKRNLHPLKAKELEW